MDTIRTTSKDALKRSLMQMYQGDVATMERMYDFYMKDMEKVPDFLRSKGVKNVTFNLYPGVKHQITKRMLDSTTDFVSPTLQSR